MMVSFRVSPFVELVTFGSVNPITLAPNLLAAVSNDKRVRVDGSKNKVATTRSSKFCGLDASQIPVPYNKVHDFVFT